MSTKAGPVANVPASEQAAAWLMALETAALTPEERARFIDWLRESPRNVAEILHVSKLHRRMETFSLWDQIEPAAPAILQSQVLPFPEATERTGRYLAYKREADRGRRRMYALAASVLVLVGAAALVYRKLGPETYQTQMGEQRELQLADGTIVDIAPNSKLRVRFHETERDIDLLGGAALFHVAHNAERPFIVSTAQGRARAVGTAFSVDQRGPDMIVTVVEGRVAVSGPSAPPAANSGQAIRADRANGSVTIGANQQVRVDQSGALTSVVPIEGEREVSWAYGRLSFENETIAEVVGKFNQYNRARIRLNDPALASKRISGNFRASDIESFAQFVHTVAGAPVSRGENDEIVIGRDGAIPQAEVRQ